MVHSSHLYADDPTINLIDNHETMPKHESSQTSPTPCTHVFLGHHNTCTVAPEDCCNAAALRARHNAMVYQSYGVTDEALNQSFYSTLQHGWRKSSQQSKIHGPPRMARPRQPVPTTTLQNGWSPVCIGWWKFTVTPPSGCSCQALQCRST